MNPRTNIVERAQQRQTNSRRTKFAGALMLAGAPIIAGTGFGLPLLMAGALTYGFGAMHSRDRDSNILENNPATRSLSLYNGEVNDISRGMKNWALVTSAVMGLFGGLPGVFELARLPMMFVAWKGIQDASNLRDDTARTISNPQTTPPAAPAVSRASLSLLPS